MIRYASLLILIALITSCTTPQPAKREDAVLSGEDTAKSAADAHRAAVEADNTGVIIASSHREEPATQPDEPTTQPTPEPAKLEIQLIKGTPTLNGEPIADIVTTVRGALAADPNLVVVVSSSEEVEHARVTELLDAVKEAGAQRVKVVIKVEKTDEKGPQEQPAKPAPSE